MADKKFGLKRLLSLYAIQAKMDLAWLLRDTGFAVMAIVSDFVMNASMISGVFLIALRFGGIGGMSEDEVLLMMAYTTLVTGIYQIFFAGGNTGHISRIIGRGQLEHLLIQPVPLPAQLITAGFIPFTGSGAFVSGIIILAIALSRLGLAVTPLWLAALAGNLLITIACILAYSYLLGSAAFHAPVAAEEISMYAIDSTGTISVYPLSGMPKWLQLPLLTLVPSGLLAWFPTLALLGRPPLGLPGYFPAAVTAVMASFAYILFRKGLNYYARKGSNRYTSGGFRS